MAFATVFVVYLTHAISGKPLTTLKTTATSAPAKKVTMSKPVVTKKAAPKKKTK
jgi:hypothetical protein